MYYRLDKQLTQMNSEDFLQDQQPWVCIFTSQEWIQVRRQFPLLPDTEKPLDTIRFCQAESYQEYLFGTFCIPQKKQYENFIRFAYYAFDGNMIWIDDTGFVQQAINQIRNSNSQKSYGLNSFLLGFLELLIHDDLQYLEDLEEQLAQIEDTILSGTFQHPNYKIISLKKEILRFDRYYSQLIDICECFLENSNGCFSENSLSMFRLLNDRISRLQSETQLLREYSTQVRELYQAEIEIRQNKIMKILTIVTTIFLPLSLIVGWYGMNFVNMPELSWRFGYPVVIAVCIIVVMICLLIFKKKKFW